MQNLETIFWSNNSGIKSLFIIVAHPDDFEIGCLGAVLRMYKSNFRFKIYILVTNVTIINDKAWKTRFILNFYFFINNS